AGGARMTSDYRELLEVVNAFDVRYLIVGGHAVMMYTEPRLTKDLDLWIASDLQNAERVYAALTRFGAPLSGCTAADFTREELWFQIGVAPVRVDILLSITGGSFEEAWSRRVASAFLGVPAYFILKGVLILTKESSDNSRV